MRLGGTTFLALLAVAGLSGCGGAPAPGDGAAYQPVNADAAVFWDRQTADTAGLLGEITDEFNATNPGVPVRLEYAGGYSEIYRKVIASLRAGVAPALAVGYPNMTLHYAREGAVTALDPFIDDPTTGFTPEELADFLPAALETNRYAALGGQMYSFPFAKSVLVLYYSRELLDAAGLDAPPATWDEFLAQCRQITARTGKPAYAIDLDCSTISGFIYSRGGEVYAGGQTRYDSPEAVAVFTLFATIVNEGLGYVIAGGFDDQVAVSQGQAAFSFRSSAGRQQMAEVMVTNPGAWGIAPIPQADPAKPATVLYGPDFVVFAGPAAHQASAWSFIRHFTSVDAQVRWALGSGYVPVRKSAMNDPRIAAFMDAAPQNRTAFDVLAHARAEPNIAGWEHVRDLVEQAAADVVTGRATPQEACATLKKDAEAALAAKP
jgi:ABC-type glycerol-3-phosphate transport system substrate-binding protein